MKEWQIKAHGPIQAQVQLPGCKSFTNRALICAALATGDSQLLNPSLSEDSQKMVELLRSLKVEIHNNHSSFTVKGLGTTPTLSGEEIHVGEAGTVLRFLLPYLAAGRGKCVVDGGPRMRQRPIAPLLKALRELGAKIESLDQENHLPLRLEARGLQAKKLRIPSEESSQFLSGLWLTAPVFGAEDCFESEGAASSLPYLEMTKVVKEAFLHPSKKSYQACHYSIPQDAASAFFYAAAVALAGGKLQIKRLSNDPVTEKLSGITLSGKTGFKATRNGESVKFEKGELKPLQLNCVDIPDLVPLLTVLSLFAKGESHLKGIGHLRGKESNRLEVLAGELTKVGAKIQVNDSSLQISGGNPLCAALLDPQNDHRMVFAFALLGLCVPGIRVLNPQCAAKSYPNFQSEFIRLFDKQETTLNNPASL